MNNKWQQITMCLPGHVRVFQLRRVTPTSTALDPTSGTTGQTNVVNLSRSRIGDS